MLLKASGLAGAYFRFWLASSFPTSSSPFSLSPSLSPSLPLSLPPSPLLSPVHSPLFFLFPFLLLFLLGFLFASLPTLLSLLPSSLFFSPFFSPPRVSLYLCRSYLVPWESARAIRTARATERESKFLVSFFGHRFCFCILIIGPLAHHWSWTLPASDRFLRLSNIR